MKSNNAEILKTLKEIRDRDYPEVQDEILERIVEIQLQYQDDPAYREAETIKAITNLVVEMEENDAF